MDYFETLSLCQKLNLLMSNGKLLKSVIHEHRRINLYVMDNKYYEARFDPAGFLIDKIEEMKEGSAFRDYLQGK